MCTFCMINKLIKNTTQYDLRSLFYFCRENECMHMHYIAEMELVCTTEVIRFHSQLIEKPEKIQATMNVVVL